MKGLKTSCKDVDIDIAAIVKSTIDLSFARDFVVFYDSLKLTK